MALTYSLMALEFEEFNAASRAQDLRPAASKAGKDRARHAEKAGRKPRMIGDVEVDKALHGGDIRPNPLSGKGWNLNRQQSAP